MLQSVIRNLVDSNDEEERLAQRSKLESDLEVANERLDTLVQGRPMLIRLYTSVYISIHTYIAMSILYPYVRVSHMPVPIIVHPLMLVHCFLVPRSIS
jgi:hypothetical protein